MSIESAAYMLADLGFELTKRGFQEMFDEGLLNEEGVRRWTAVKDLTFEDILPEYKLQSILKLLPALNEIYEECNNP